MEGMFLGSTLEEQYMGHEGDAVRELQRAHGHE